MAPSLEDFVALDCEMVTLRYGDTKMALGRVAIVDAKGSIVYDSLVRQPHENIINYNTSSSGIRPGQLDDAPEYKDVRYKVWELTKGKYVVGHALFNDLAVLRLRLPIDKIRDTALLYKLRLEMNVTKEGQYPGLRHMSKAMLDGKKIQEKGDAHDPVIDARTTMQIYLKHRDFWEEAEATGKDDHVACVPGHFSEWYV